MAGEVFNALVQQAFSGSDPMQSFIRAKQAKQAIDLNNLAMQQQVQQGPLQSELLMQKLAQLKQSNASQQQQDKLVDSLLLMDIAKSAKKTPNLEARKEFLFGAASRLGIEDRVEDGDELDSNLDQIIAAGDAASQDSDMTEFQRQNLEVQRERLGLERLKTEQANQRIQLGLERLGKSVDPGLQEDLAAAKSRGKEIGSSEGKLISGLPNSIQISTSTLSVIDDIINHPGRATATGLSGVIDPRNFTPGTDAHDFALLNQQLQGKTFLEAFKSLKGGGQITQVEGEKAERAIAQLSRAQSDEQYLKSINELRKIAFSAKQTAEKQLFERQTINSGNSTAPPENNDLRSRIESLSNEERDKLLSELTIEEKRKLGIIKGGR